MPSRRLSGYDLEWLQTISLAGLQTLARAHGVEDEAESVPELIELLARDEAEDEEGEFFDHDKAEFFGSSPVRGRPPVSSQANDVADEPSEEEEEEEEEEEKEEEEEQEEAEAEVEMEAEVATGDASPIDVTDQAHAALAPVPVAAPPPISVPSGSARRALPRSEASGKIKPWTAAAKSFLPKVSTKSTVVAAKPVAVVAVVAPIGGGASGGEASAQKALDSARSKKMEEEKKQQAAQARREAAQARRERILSAFKKTQANIQQQANVQPLKVISSKTPAAWEMTAARATKQQQQATAKARVAAGASK
jgi:hypothetical protein